MHGRGRDDTAEQARSGAGHNGGEQVGTYVLHPTGANGAGAESGQQAEADARGQPGYAAAQRRWLQGSGGIAAYREQPRDCPSGKRHGENGYLPPC